MRGQQTSVGQIHRIRDPVGQIVQCLYDIPRRQIDDTDDRRICARGPAMRNVRSIRTNPKPLLPPIAPMG
jgi:hypothetical protein